MRMRIIAALLSFVLLATGCASADVTAEISNKVVNTVNPLIFGDNLSWRGNGYGVLNSETGLLDESLIEAFAQSGITHLRYPGGIEADYFHWQESIGSNRVSQIDPFSKDWPTEASIAGQRYIPAFGFDEFLSLCQATGIAPTVILNVGTGTPQEAADWILYCLAKGAQVTSFDVGNEVHFWHEQVPGITIAKTEEEYIAFFSELRELLQQKLGNNTQGIRLGAIGLPSCHPLSVRKGWDKKILTALASEINYFDVHIGYSTYNVNGAKSQDILKALMASGEWVRQMLVDVKQEITQFTGEYAKDIDIHITEMGPMTASFHSNTVAGALFQADLFNILLRESKVTSANHLPAINHYAAANVIGTADFPVVSKKQGRVFWKNAVSYVFDLFTPLAGQKVLSVAMGGDTFFSPKVGLTKAMDNVHMGDVGAYQDAQGNLTLIALCRDTEAAQSFTVILPDDEFCVASIQRLYNKDPFAYNNWVRNSVALETLSSDEVSVTGRQLTFSAPPVSLWKIVLEKKR